MGEVERGEVERSTIVIGVDGSPEAAEALAWAERFAAPGDALTALRAWETPYVPLPTTVWTSSSSPSARAITSSCSITTTS